MCGRYTVHSPREAIGKRFELSAESLAELDVHARYNVAPTQEVLTIAVGREGERKPILMQWGLIPPWEPHPSTKLSTINAKLETAPESRLYRSAFAKRRCLIVADGFYEWQPGETPKSRKTPFWIARADRAPFAFAGLYSVWRPKDQPDAAPVLSCSIITTAANAIVEPVHGRMPLILQPEHEAAWIDPTLQDPERVRALLKPDADSLVTRAVSTRVNSVANDRAELLERPPDPR